MERKTRRLLWLGAVSAGYATAFFLSPIVGREFAPPFGMAAGWIYAIFAFQPAARAIAMSSTLALSLFGITYFFNVRRDLSGFAVMLLCYAISFAIFWPLRVQEKRSSLPGER